MATIYILTNLINKKQYVGQTTRNLKERIAEHRYTNNIKEKHLPLHKAIKKYDIKNFKIISFSCPEEDLDWAETLFIKELNTLSPVGYNLETGGNKNKHHHPLTTQTLREKNMGENNPMFGKTPWNKGVPRTEQEKKNISLNLIGKTKGRPKEKEHKRKISEAHKGLTHTEETRKKLSILLKGKPAWNKGIPQSKNVKEAVSKANKGKHYSPNTEFKKGNKSFLGKHHTEATRKKMRLAWEKRRQNNDKKF